MSTFPTAAPVLPFRLSRTCRCLQEACHDKQRTRSLYLEAAHALEADGLHVIAHAFRFAASQEEEHAAVLGGLLTFFGGERELPPVGDIPPLPRDPAGMLRAAAEAEHDAWNERAPQCIRAAQEEGFSRIAAALGRIAETDQLHARRFVQYMEAHAGGRLFQDEQRVSWVCLSCGLLHTGCRPPDHCPGCSGVQGHFIRSSFFPFAVEE